MCRSLESTSWNLLKVPAEEQLMYSNAWFDCINVLSISDVCGRPVKLSLLPSIGRRGIGQSWSLQPSCGKSVQGHILPLSGNYVFYLGDTYRYFNIGNPAILMGHYSNKWGENTVGLVTPSVRQGPPSRHTCWDKVTFITDTFAGQKQNGRWGQR